MNLNSWWSKCKMEVLGKSFYSLSFNFQKVSNFNQSHNNQTTNQNNLFVYNIPKFRILGCYKLPPLKWISSSRFGEARKEVRFGGHLENPFIHTRCGVLPPLGAWLRFQQNSCTHPLGWRCQSSHILWVNSFTSALLVRAWPFPQTQESLHQIRSFWIWVFLAVRLSPMLNNYRKSHDGQQLLVPPAGNESGLNLTA